MIAHRALAVRRENLEDTAVTLVTLAVLVVASAAAWLLPRPWGLVNLLTQVLTGLLTLVVGAVLFVMSLDRLVRFSTPPLRSLNCRPLPAANRR